MVRMVTGNLIISDTETSRMLMEYFAVRGVETFSQLYYIRVSDLPYFKFQEDFG